MEDIVLAHSRMLVENELLILEIQKRFCDDLGDHA